jgi:hypothetical protein
MHTHTVLNIPYPYTSIPATTCQVMIIWTEEGAVDGCIMTFQQKYLLTSLIIPDRCLTRPCLSSDVWLAWANRPVKLPTIIIKINAQPVPPHRDFPYLDPGYFTHAAMINMINPTTNEQA